LEEFVEGEGVGAYGLEQLIPSFLQGFVTEEGGWQLYIATLTRRLSFFSMALYILSFAFFLCITFLIDSLSQCPSRHTRSFVMRVLIVNILLVGISFRMAVRFRQGQFAKSVEAKTIFARPFFDKISEAPEVSTLPTTLVQRKDVLLGMRLDSRHIGNYVRFLDYHPGNVDWRREMKWNSDTYTSYGGLPSIFLNKIISNVRENVFLNTGGRFLLQNELGEWTVMQMNDYDREIMKTLSFESKELSSVIRNEISMLRDDAMFGTTLRRSKVMKETSLAALSQWDKLVEEQTIVQPDTSSTDFSFIPKRKFNKTSTFRIQSVPIRRVNKKRKIGPHYIYPRTEHNLQVNDEILANYQGSGYLFAARIVAIEYENYALIEFTNNGIQANVLLTKVSRFRPLKDDDSIVISHQNCSKCPVSFIPATIDKALPNNRCDVIFSDGKHQEDVPPDTIGRSP
jgi:hypothetical protein